MNRLKFLIIIAVAVALSIGCSGKPKRAKTGFDSGAIAAKSAQAQQDFDDALAELERGEWMSARESFRMLQAQFPNDPIAVVAELYIARAGMREIDWLVSDSERSDMSDESERVLAQLHNDASVDSRVRFAATVYLAVLNLGRGDRNAAVGLLDDYPSSSISPVVLERDQSAIALLVASAHEANARHADAISAWEALWRSTERSDLRLLARSSAFEAAKRVSDEDVQEMTTESDSSFVRAVAGWEWVRRRLEEEPSDSERESLAALNQRVSADLVAIGESVRAAEHGAALAAWGPVRKLVLGAVLPMSGDKAGVGRRAAEAMMVAQKSVNSRGEPQVTLVVIDSAREPADVFSELKEAGASAVIGPLDGARTAAFAPEARAAGIPMISLSPTTLDSVEAAGEWVFRFFVDAVEEARAVARIATSEHQDRRAAIVYPDIGYGRTLAAAFREAFEAEGGTVVAERAYDPSKTDYSAVARTVAGAKPDAVFIPGRPSKVAEVAAFLAQANIWGIPGDQRPSPKSKRVQVHYLGTSLWADPVVAEQAGTYLNGALIPAWSSPLFEDGPSVKFHGQFQGAAGKSPELFDSVIADSVLFGRSMLVELGVSRPEAFRDTIRAPRVYDGVAGTVGFGADGEPIRTLRFINVSDGGFVASPLKIETGRVSDDTPVN